MQVVVFPVLHDDLLPVADTVSQIIAQARLRGIHVGGGGTVAQVTVYYQYLLFLDDEAHGDVHGEERLAAAGIERGQHEHVLTAVLARHEVHVGAQHTERLVDDVTVAFLHHDGFHVGLCLLIEPQFLSGAEILGNLADERNAQAFQVLTPAYLGIHVLLHEDNHRRHKQTDGECHQKDVHLPGGCGKHATPWGGNHTCIVGGESLRKLVLLTFLEQVEIQFLLHLLLAFHG